MATLTKDRSPINLVSWHQKHIHIQVMANFSILGESSTNHKTTLRLNDLLDRCTGFTNKLLYKWL